MAGKLQRAQKKHREWTLRRPVDAGLWRASRDYTRGKNLTQRRTANGHEWETRMDAKYTNIAKRLD
jgi:hypothetical protein